MKSSNQFFINKMGSAYILVMITMATVFIFLGIILHTISYEVEVSSTYKKNANLYDLATSGVDKVTFLMNSILSEQEHEISSQVLTNLRETSIANLAQYSSETGKFHINRTDYTNFLAQAVDKIVIDDLRRSTTTVTNVINPTNEKYKFSYLIEGDSQEEGIHNYEISVEISANSVNIPKIFNIISTAKAVNGNVTVSVEARVVLSTQNYSSDDDSSDTDYSGTINARYKWKNTPPEWAVSTNNMQSTYFFPEVLTDVNNWYQDDKVFVYGALNSPLDISSFYENGIPTPTAIINISGESFILRASDPYRNKFEGIIFSNSSIHIDSLDITGSIISAGDITSNDTIFYSDANMLFKIPISSTELENMLLDFLGVTNFRGVAQGEQAKVSDVLKEIDLAQNLSYDLRYDLSIYVPMEYRVINLWQLYQDN